MRVLNLLMLFALVACLRRGSQSTGITREVRLHKRLAHEVYSPAGSTRVFVPRLYPIREDNYSLDPLIYHIRLERDYPSIVEAILKELENSSVDSIPRGYIEDLMAFGSIYYARKQGEKVRRVVVQDSDSEEPQPVKDAYLRVHLNPRRYPAAIDMDIRADGGIIYEDDRLLCYDKPEGVPTTETVDNLVESLRGQLRCQFTSGQKLETASRLDACTQGVVVFAKLDKDRENGVDLIGRLNKAFRERYVIKRYRLRCRRKPKVLEGKVTHFYMKRKGKGSTPGVLYSANDDLNTLSTCNLHIVSAKESSFQNEQGEPMWLIEVILGTGLTHQIRLQFAALGACIFRDLRYYPVEGLTIDPSDENTMDLPSLGNTVTGGIDLQCASMTFPAGTITDKEMTFSAACPDWWV